MGRLHIRMLGLEDGDAVLSKENDVFAAQGFFQYRRLMKLEDGGGELSG